MPLSFPSTSHGDIAFGFFNIDTDLLLLENYFFFADFFCSRVSAYAESPVAGSYTDTWPIFAIAQRENIGDLMGAIHGIRHTGFIGEVYRMFPFPAHPDAFKQKTKGYENRDAVKKIIGSYSEKIDILFSINPDTLQVSIGDFNFELAVFNNLINYVCQGGYPRWLNEEMPGYVNDMVVCLQTSSNKAFKGYALKS